MTIDYRAYPILYVDDERANLAALKYAFEEDFNILTTTSPADALKLMHEHHVAVLVADQRMPEMTGVELCEKAAQVCPDAVRIILTAYADIHAAIEAINRGRVTRYVSKPFQNEDLAEILRTAVELVHIQRTVQQMEVRLLRVGPSASASTISSELAHELNNVVQPALANLAIAAELVKETRQSLPEGAHGAHRLLQEMDELHADVSRGVGHVLEVVERMRVRSRSAPPARCDVARVVDSMIRIVRSELEAVAHLQVTFEGAPQVAMDSAALGQVVLNLLLNAAQAVQESPDRPGSIDVGVATMERMAVVSVSDTGPGVPDQLRERIFDAFFTTKKDGSGLGLAVVRRLVSEHDGAIELHSHEGRGTTVIVRLPLAST